MQLLVYPVTDFRRLDASHRTFAKGYLLTAESIGYKALYAAPDDADPMVLPCSIQTIPSCPRPSVTAGFDPLRDEESDSCMPSNSGTPPAG